MQPTNFYPTPRAPLAVLDGYSSEVAKEERKLPPPRALGPVPQLAREDHAQARLPRELELLLTYCTTRIEVSISSLSKMMTV